ncbi:MAG: L,D-transpeptidase family protein, partial [Lachnospiraceae bacterium]|nr:L,D-transpeptidase family protein [Lachnospiraceae bacterium]
EIKEEKNSEKTETEENAEKKPEEIKGENKKEINSNSKAISQSKKLADVNAVEEEVRKKNKAVNQTKKMSSKKVTGIVIGCLAAILLIVYAVGFVYFSGHFYKNVTINGITVSGLDALDAKRTLDEFYTDYILTIHTVDKKKDIAIAAKDIAMQIQTKDEYGNRLKNQQANLWFVNMFKMYEFHIDADTSWDENKLQDFYDSCDILRKKNMKKPVDAYVGVKDGKFAIVDEVTGSTLSVDKFKTVVENSLSEVVPEIDLMEKGCYALPKVYADDDELKKDLDAKNEFAKNEIKIKLDDLTLEPGMELYEEVLKKSGSAYIIDDSKVKKYVEKLAKEYDTVATKREFETSFSNRKVDVLGSMFGYELDQELTLDALLKALKSGKTTTVEAEFKSKGITLQGDNDIGNSYIEVNLSEQKVVAYKDGKKIAEGDCVSGNESAGHGTCTGLYAIQGKQSPAVLRGEKKPVTKTVTKKKKGKKVTVQETTYEYEYESPVTFWMPFNGGIGLHDAAGWRSSYGGSIYRYSGSHGCVNLPYDLAKELYNTFDVGTPVIVYFWDNENRE